ncbi:hypothetical protein EDB89DRAFT_1906341 [Lactarius sanguifluus]|nr:hypothetical protein EDB89DRAFT_1906341 [Lactarius sanguifluus]
MGNNAFFFLGTHLNDRALQLMHSSAYYVELKTKLGSHWQVQKRMGPYSRFPVNTTGNDGHSLSLAHWHPYVEGAFFLPSASQLEVFNTLIQVTGHTLLVSAYFDTCLGPNPNLKRDFPYIPWCGEIAVLFIGKRKPFVNYMGLCIACVELGSPFPAYMKSEGPPDECTLVTY